MSWTAWANPTSPNLADFQLFIAQNMNLGPGYVPANSPFPQYALNAALARVIPPVPGISGGDYTFVVYNCAGHLLLDMLPPQAGTPLFPEMRRKLGFMSPQFGLVQSSSDQGTSDVLAIPDALKQLTLDDLYFAQTKYGRIYLAYNQAFGPDPFGVS